MQTSGRFGSPMTTLLVAILLAVAPLAGAMPLVPLGQTTQSEATIALDRRGASDAHSVTAGSAAHWRAIITGLGRRRADVWRRGDPGLLRLVFVPGSPPWEEERRMLQAYRDRGLRVLGLGLTVHDVTLDASGPRWVRLWVVDTVHPSVARRDRSRYRLPRDAPTRHLLTLHRSGPRWRISAIRPVAS